MNKIDIEIDLNKDYTQRIVQGIQIAEFSIKINNVKLPHYFACPTFIHGKQASENQIITYIVTSSIQNAQYVPQFSNALVFLSLDEEEKEFVANYIDDQLHLTQARTLIDKYFNVSFVADIKRIAKWVAR